MSRPLLLRPRSTTRLLLSLAFILAFVAGQSTFAAGTLKTGDKISTTDILTVRSAPNGTRIGIQPLGAKGSIVSETPTMANGYQWYKINYAEGTDGWSAGEYLSAETLVAATNEVISVFTGSPLKTPKGTDVTLQWNQSNASSCTGKNFSTGGRIEGSVVVAPRKDTTYSLSCKNGDTTLSTKRVRVDTYTITTTTDPVPPPPPPPTDPDPVPPPPPPPTDPVPTPTGAWSITQNSSGQSVAPTTSKYGAVTFGYANRDKLLHSGFPIGHGIPASEHVLFYNLSLDGYGGLPQKSCLRRSYLLADSDPTKAICAANENDDLFRAWTTKNTLLKTLLIKNVDVRNAFRSHNYADGIIAKELPHTDTFQSYYGSGPEPAEWIVIQDSIFKNSDNSMMIWDARWKGVVLQNLKNGCDAWFADDARQRWANDRREFGLATTDEEMLKRAVCTNSLTAKAKDGSPVWVIGMPNKVRVINGTGPTIVVGAGTTISTDSSGPKCYYATIEAALADTDASDGCGNFEKPPYLELSCVGWGTAPAGCTSQVGSSKQIATPVSGLALVPSPTRYTSATLQTIRDTLEELLQYLKP